MHVGKIGVLSDSLTKCYAKFASEATRVILSAHAFNINYQLAGHYIIRDKPDVAFLSIQKHVAGCYPIQ